MDNSRESLSTSGVTSSNIHPACDGKVPMPAPVIQPNNVSPTKTPKKKRQTSPTKGLGRKSPSKSISIQRRNGGYIVT